MASTPIIPVQVHQRIRQRAALALALVLLAVAAIRPAQADARPRLSLDIGSPTATSVLVLPNATMMLKHSRANSGAGALENRPGGLDAFADPPFVPQAWFDEMVGSHQIKWQYDRDWSSSLGSDYPRLRTPSYLIGNGSPGMAQRVWIQFSLVRRF